MPAVVDEQPARASSGTSVAVCEPQPGRPNSACIARIAQVDLVDHVGTVWVADIEEVKPFETDRHWTWNDLSWRTGRVIHLAAGLRRRERERPTCG